MFYDNLTLMGVLFCVVFVFKNEINYIFKWRFDLFNVVSIFKIQNGMMIDNKNI
jgi:hypothetical protein